MSKLPPSLLPLRLPLLPLLPRLRRTAATLAAMAPLMMLTGCSLTATAQTSAAASGLATIDPRDRGQGVAVPIGGGLKAEHEAVWRKLVELSGGPGSRWVVLGTASGEPIASAEQAAANLKRRGAVAEVLPVSPLLKDKPIAEAVRDAALIEQVKRARGVFFTGGSQDRIVDHLFPGGQATPLLQAIWQLYRSGGVVAGTSAGAAIMSTTMFRDAPSPLAVMQGRWEDGKEVDRGLGFVGPALFVDQHFLERGRIARMLPLMVAKGYRIGLGVEEDSAVVVRGDQVEVFGKALLVDLAKAQADPRARPFALKGAQVSLLDSGDKLSLTTLAIEPAEHKRKGQRLEPGSPGYKPYYELQPFHVDVLGRGVISTAMGQLIDAKYDEVRGLAFDPRSRADDPLGALGFEFRLYKGEGSSGWYSDAFGGEDYTVQRLWLDVAPVRIAQPVFRPWTP